MAIDLCSSSSVYPHFLHFSFQMLPTLKNVAVLLNTTAVTTIVSNAWKLLSALESGASGLGRSGPHKIRHGTRRKIKVYGVRGRIRSHDGVN